MNIAVLLSGGVDSSVAVHLLCEQGHRPSLFYIKIGKDDTDYMDCSAEEDLEMASAVARRYGLSLEVVDLHREYWDNVAAYAIEKVSRGFTPNPDVMCNKLIKFGALNSRSAGTSTLRQPDIMLLRSAEWKDLAGNSPRPRKRPDGLSCADRLPSSVQTDVPVGRTDETGSA
mgnify:CR=1 FL=1